MPINRQPSRRVASKSARTSRDAQSPGSSIGDGASAYAYHRPLDSSLSHHGTRSYGSNAYTYAPAAAGGSLHHHHGGGNAAGGSAAVDVHDSSLSMNNSSASTAAGGWEGGNGSTSMRRRRVGGSLVRSGNGGGGSLSNSSTSGPPIVRAGLMSPTPENNDDHHTAYVYGKQHSRQQTHSMGSHGGNSLAVPAEAVRNHMPLSPDAYTHMGSPPDGRGGASSDGNAPFTTTSPYSVTQFSGGSPSPLTPTESSAETSFFWQVVATMRRQVIQKRRSWIITSLEFILPIIFVLGLVILANNSTVTTLYSEETIPSTGAKIRRADDIHNAVCYRDEATADAVLKQVSYPCSLYEASSECADPDNRNIPFRGYCVPGGYETAHNLLMVFSGFTKSREIPNFDQMNLLKMSVNAMVPDNSLLAFWNLQININKGMTATANFGRIYVVPQNPATEQMVNYLSNRFLTFPKIFGGFRNTMADADASVKDSKTNGETYAVIHIHKMAKGDGLDFTIAVNKSGLPSFTNGIREDGKGYGTKAYSDFLASGYSTLQKTVYDYYLTQVAGADEQLYRVNAASSKVALAPMQFPPYDNNEFLEVARDMAPLVLVLAFLFPVSQLAKRLVSEKETRMREATLIMGLTKTAFFTSWLLFYAIQSLIIALVVSIILKFAVARKTDFFVIFLLYMIFSLSTITFAAMVSTIFDGAKIAGLVVPVIFLICSIPAFVVPTSTSPGLFHFLSILSPTPFAVGLKLIFKYELNNGLGFNRTNYPLDKPYPFRDCLLWLSGMTVFYLLAMIYLDMVIPKQWGVTKHPLFFVLDPYRIIKHRIVFGTFSHDPYDSEGEGVGDGMSSGSDDEEDASVASTRPTQPVNLNATTTALEAYPVSGGRATVKIRRLRKDFKSTKVRAVDDLCLRMFSNGITVVLGHNGAGKTTVMNMLTGMMPPTSGDVRIYGKSVVHDMQAIRRDIGFCPQHNILWDDLTCLEHLQYFARLKGMASKDVNAEALEMLVKVDLVDKADVLSCNLSGGQKRKLSVAIAFMGKARFVMLDEPTAGMDVVARRHTWDVLKDMSRGRTILLTTHYMDEADLLGSRIAILSKGCLHSYGTPMYLKKHLGTGYVMRIACTGAIADPTPILREVLTFVPHAEVKECKGQELAISLPKEDVKLFPDAIRHMDGLASSRAHSIVSVSMAVSTLEDVYMRIVTQAERAAVTSTTAPDETDQHLKHLFLTASAPLEEERFFDSLVRQTPAFFIKRFHYGRRNRCALFIQVVAPLISIFIAMFMVYVKLDTVPGVVFDENLLAPIDQRISTSNCQPLENYWSPTYDVDSSFNTLDTRAFSTYLGDTYNSQGDMERTFSYICDDERGDTVIFSNSSNFASAPLALQELYKARLRSLASSDPAINPTIVTRYEPLASNVADEAQVEGLQALLMAVFIMIPFTFIPSTYVSYIVRERECKAKHLQFVSGANYVAYWLGNFAFDMCSYCITMVIAFFLFGVFQRKEYIGSVDAGMAVLLIFLLYGLSGIGFAYFISYFFSNHTTAQTVVLLGNFIVGFIFVVLIFFMRNISSTVGTADVIVYFFRAIPSFCIGEAMMNIATAYTLRDLYGSFDPFAMDVAGWDMLYMGIELIVFFAAAAFLDHPGRHRRAQRLAFKRDEEAPLIDGEDEDVLQERIAVEDGLRERDIVLVKGLRKVFNMGKAEEERIAVQNLSFGVQPGEVFGFLGTNGAGKTTTMSMLTTEIMPTCGKATIGGFDVVDEAAETRKLIGYCPQFDAVVDLLTPAEHLNLFCSLRNIKRSEVASVTDALINACALKDYRDVPAGDLSGGNRRKLSVALALLGGPSIIFLDEPSAGMDPHARRQMWDVVSLVSKFSSIVLTTHHLEEVDVLAHRVGIMDAGLMKCLGSLEHLKHKFGNGYELTIQVRSFSSGERALTYLTEHLPAAMLVEARQTRMLFALPFEYTDIASLFETLHAAMENKAIGIVDFTLQQTSLEQVFMRIAELTNERSADQSVPLEGDGVGNGIGGAYLDDPAAGSFASVLKSVTTKNHLSIALFHEQSMVASQAIERRRHLASLSGAGAPDRPDRMREMRAPDCNTSMTFDHGAPVNAQSTASARYMFAVANGSRLFEASRGQQSMNGSRGGGGGTGGYYFNPNGSEGAANTAARGRYYDSRSSDVAPDFQVSGTVPHASALRRQ